MIEFMLIAGERSGSTWAANWLTTDTTLCLHDPLMRYQIGRLDWIYPCMSRRKGIACTAMQLAPDFVNAHPAPKVILHRKDEEIGASLRRIGASDYYAPGTNDRLHAIRGMHVKWSELFQPDYARLIAGYLGVPFDPFRHAELVQMNIQPQYAAVKIDKRPIQELVGRIRSILEEEPKVP